jgi:co-chaperonin GroES (HSP10)
MQLMRGSSGLAGRNVACRAATALPPKVCGRRGRVSAPCDAAGRPPGGRRASRSLSPRTPAGPQFKGVKPSGDRVLVKVDKEEGKTTGGVLLPSVAQNKPTAGAVVALGDVELVKVRRAVPAPCRSRTLGPPAAGPRPQARGGRRRAAAWGARGRRCRCSLPHAPPPVRAGGPQPTSPRPPCGPMQPFLQSGDRVVYSKYAGTEVAISGDEHVLLKVGGPASALGWDGALGVLAADTASSGAG